MTARAGLGPLSSPERTFHPDQKTSGTWIVFMLRWRCCASGARRAGGVSLERNREYTQDNGEEKCSLRHCVSSVARFYHILMGLSRRRRTSCRRSCWSRRSAVSGEFITHQKSLDLNFYKEMAASEGGTIITWRCKGNGYHICFSVTCNVALVMCDSNAASVVMTLSTLVRASHNATPSLQYVYSRCEEGRTNHNSV